MGFNGINLWQKESQIAKVIETNQRTAKFGLSLTEEEAEEILKTGSAVGYVWYNNQIEIEKIVFANVSSYF